MDGTYPKTLCYLTYNPMTRLLFGVDTVKKRMSEAKFHIDSFFTGADFPHAALVLIETAIRRRHLDYLTSSGCFKHSFLFKTKNQKFEKRLPLTGTGSNLHG